MSLLFREFVFCECGRPAQAHSPCCRTCYEDGLRRKWREETCQQVGARIPAELRRVGIRELRQMRVWRREDDAERCWQTVLGNPDRAPHVAPRPSVAGPAGEVA